MNGLLNNYEKNYTVCIADIDFFKGVNDTYGHNVGDHVLLEFATYLNDAITSDDLLLRWGGEEFVLILQGNYQENVLKIKDICRNMHHVQWPNDIHLTASFGCAVYNKSSVEAFQTVIEQADHYLYLAKDQGRDQVQAQ